MYRVNRKRKPTLFPLIALSALGLVVTLPLFSDTSLHAAPVAHYATATVHPGETLWSIAAAHTDADGNVQDTIDRIVTINHLPTGSIAPGLRLRIPE